MLNQIKNHIKKLLQSAGVPGKVEFSSPPKPELGDLALACFDIAKEWRTSPAEAAKELAAKIESQLLLAPYSLLLKVTASGPYVNFFLNTNAVAEAVLTTIKKTGKKYGSSPIGRKKKVMVEFAHPNTHKQVHIGHLRNMITGESVVRILENAGYKVARANYQGDVGMHIAKALWGLWQVQKSKVKSQNLEERIKILGEAYVVGSRAYEENETAKKEIEDINEKIYSQSDKVINKLYKETRKWSLAYFNYIYKRTGIKRFDRLYFESEVFALGKKIVLDGLKQGIFKESEGAVIFAGSRYGLHDRVFINSRGLSTYEAKDQALARLQFKEYNPDFILHVVAREQTEYFKVVFKALEFTLPKSASKEKHLVYGWVSLKEGKMSSRTGQVVLAEWLLDEAEKKVAEAMAGRKIKNKAEVIRKVAGAAVKYAMLKTGIGNDIVFDFKESVSLAGDSGPYLLYICARINSIVKKSKFKSQKSKLIVPTKIEPTEKKLLLDLAKFEEATAKAAVETDPSQIAKYLFQLAQSFNNFYQVCPVLNAEGQVKFFRFNLIEAVKQVMEKGLSLLGIEVVEEM